VQKARGSAALLVAGLVGWASGSVLVFLIALIVLLVAGQPTPDVRRRLPAVRLPARALACKQADARAGSSALPSVK
jgi:hypothetical protein